MKRARVVEITFAPKLERMPEITLRKNAFWRAAHRRGVRQDHRLFGCARRLGRPHQLRNQGCLHHRQGGTAATVGGTPTYAVVAYTGADYQVFIGRRVAALPGDSSVTYEPPVAAPDDDGINFQFPLGVNDVVVGGVTVRNAPHEQRARISETIAGFPMGKIASPKVICSACPVRPLWFSRRSPGNAGGSRQGHQRLAKGGTDES